MLKIHCLQHEHFEGAANIGRWALQRGCRMSHTLLYDNQALPESRDFDWLIVMGGGMGTYEEEKYPWLRAEKRFIAAAIEDSKKVLGVCLGAQLIANALGADVFPGPEKEIGWFPVRLTAEAGSSLLADFPPVFTPLHWHGDTFDLPHGAIRLAESDAYPNQAFQYGANVLGLQFHLELSRLDVQAFLSAASAPGPSRFVQTGEEILERAKNFEMNQTLLLKLLEKFCPAATSSAIS